MEFNRLKCFLSKIVNKNEDMVSTDKRNIDSLNMKLNELSEKIDTIGSEVSALSQRMDKLIQSVNLIVQKEVAKDMQKDKDVQLCIANLNDVFNTVWMACCSIEGRDEKRINQFVASVSNYFHQVMLGKKADAAGITREARKLGLKHIQTTLDDIKQCVCIRDKMLKLMPEDRFIDGLLCPEAGDSYDPQRHDEIFSSSLQTGERADKLIKQTVFFGFSYGESFASFKPKVICK